MKLNKRNNYYFMFRYQEWLLLTQLLKPMQRDILFTVVCRRAVCNATNKIVDDYEMDGLLMQFYNRMRKDAWNRHLKPLIDQGLITKHKTDLPGGSSYSTQLNDAMELELAMSEERQAIREAKKLKKEQEEKELREFEQDLSPKSNELKTLFALHKDKYKK